MAGRKTRDHRPGKVTKQVMDGVTRRRRPVRFITTVQLANHDPGGATKDAGLPQLRHHPIEAIGPLPDVLDEEHITAWRIERVWRSERREKLRQVSTEQSPARLSFVNRFEPRRHQLAE